MKESYEEFMEYLRVEVQLDVPGDININEIKKAFFIAYLAGLKEGVLKTPLGNR